MRQTCSQRFKLMETNMLSKTKSRGHVLLWRALSTLSRDGNLHSSGTSHVMTASPKPSFGTPWREVDAVVGRGNAGCTTIHNGLLQKRLEEDLCCILSRVPPTTQSVRGLNWTELNWTELVSLEPMFSEMNHLVDTFSCWDRTTWFVSYWDRSTGIVPRWDKSTGIVPRWDRSTGIVSCWDRSAGIVPCWDRSTWNMSCWDRTTWIVSCRKKVIF